MCLTSRLDGRTYFKDVKKIKGQFDYFKKKLKIKLINGYKFKDQKAYSRQSKHKIWIAFVEKTKMPNENYI